MSIPVWATNSSLNPGPSPITEGFGLLPLRSLLLPDVFSEVSRRPWATFKQPGIPPRLPIVNEIQLEIQE